MACHNPSYVTKDYDIVRDVKPGGAFLHQLPVDARGAGGAPAGRMLSATSPRTTSSSTLINAIDLAIEIGMGKRTNTILQSAFFTLAEGHARRRRPSST